MRAVLLIALALAAGIQPALADPRCARLGQPAYTAMRLTSTDGAPATATRVTLDGPRLRIEAPAPAPAPTSGRGQGRVVTLITPELHALFLTTAEPPVALRMPIPAPPGAGAQDRREREERSRGGVTLITELRGASGQWHVVERSTCRRDGVLLEAWQWQPGPAGSQVVETRQSDIRTVRADPALFRLPAGFRLIEAPPAQALSRRTAPPPG